MNEVSATEGEEALGQFALPVGAHLRIIWKDKSEDVFDIVDTDYVLRVPKFTDEEIPNSEYSRLVEKYHELRRFVGIAIPRFVTVVAEGQVPPMSEAGDVNYMIVQKVHGQSLDLAVAADLVPSEQIIDLLAGLAKYLHHCGHLQQDYVSDLCHLDQYRYGSSGLEVKDRIWLTDLEPRYQRLSYEPTWNDLKLFLMEIGELIKSLLHCETTMGYPLSSPRAELERLLDYVGMLDSEVALEMKGSLRDPAAGGDYYSAEWFRRKH